MKIFQAKTNIFDNFSCWTRSVRNFLLCTKKEWNELLSAIYKYSFNIYRNALSTLKRHIERLMTLADYMFNNCRLRHNSKCNVFLLHSLSIEAETTKHQLSNRPIFMWYWWTLWQKTLQYINMFHLIHQKIAIFDGQLLYITRKSISPYSTSDSNKLSLKKNPYILSSSDGLNSTIFV